MDPLPSFPKTGTGPSGTIRYPTWGGIEREARVRMHPGFALRHRGSQARAEPGDDPRRGEMRGTEIAGQKRDANDHVVGYSSLRKKYPFPVIPAAASNSCVGGTVPCFAPMQLPG